MWYIVFLIINYICICYGARFIKPFIKTVYDLQCVIFCLLIPIAGIVLMALCIMYRDEKFRNIDLPEEKTSISFANRFFLQW